MAESFRAYREEVQVMKTLCDYCQLFAHVNRELIQSDKDKKRRKKRTRRFPISKMFVEATEHLETILHSLKYLKVQSISEILHKDGVDLPPEQQRHISYPSKLRSLFDHFHEITDLERQHLDLREYRVIYEEKRHD